MCRSTLEPIWNNSCQTLMLLCHATGQSRNKSVTVRLIKTYPSLKNELVTVQLYEEIPIHQYKYGITENTPWLHGLQCPRALLQKSKLNPRKSLWNFENMRKSSLMKKHNDCRSTNHGTTRSTLYQDKP